MEKIQKGKKMLLAMIFAMLFLEIVLILMNARSYISIGNTEAAVSSLTEGTIRFFITGALLFFVYKGKPWARWIIIVLFLLGSLIAFVLFNFITVALGIIYTSFCMMLMFSSSIKAFLAYQNQ